MRCVLLNAVVLRILTKGPVIARIIVGFGLVLLSVRFLRCCFRSVLVMLSLRLKRITLLARLETLQWFMSLTTWIVWIGVAIPWFTRLGVSVTGFVLLSMIIPLVVTFTLTLRGNGIGLFALL